MLIKFFNLFTINTGCNSTTTFFALVTELWIVNSSTNFEKMELVNTNICHHNEIQIVPKLKRKPELLDGRKDHNLVYITSTYSDFTFVFLFLFECPYIGIVICNHKKIINLNLDFCDFLVKS